MSRLRQYVFFGGLVLLLQWTSLSRLLQSISFLNVVAGIIAVLLVVAVLITLPHMKKKWREHKEEPFGEDERD